MRQHQVTNRLRASALVIAVLTLSMLSSAQYTGNIRIPQGYVQVEGDIIMPESTAAKIRKPVYKGFAPEFVYAPAHLWPNRIVPYDFDAAVTTGERTVFQAAMAEWENVFPGVTTIRFQPRNGEAGHLHFAVAPIGFCGGETDYVGYNGGRVRVIIDACWHGESDWVWTIAHEIGHALGLWHEQSRADRSPFVQIIDANIQSGYANQFSIDEASPQSTFGIYDYASIMHYPPCAFSKCVDCNYTDLNCVTIRAVYGAQQLVMGQQTHLSAMDQRSMAFMYGPPQWKFLYAKPGSSATGSFQQPYNSFSQAVVGAANSTLWLGPGTYSAAGMTISTPMVLRAAVGDLQLQPDGSLGPSTTGSAILK